MDLTHPKDLCADWKVILKPCFVFKRGKQRWIGKLRIYFNIGWMGQPQTQTVSDSKKALKRAKIFFFFSANHLYASYMCGYPWVGSEVWALFIKTSFWLVSTKVNSCQSLLREGQLKTLYIWESAQKCGTLWDTCPCCCLWILMFLRQIWSFGWGEIPTSPPFWQR